MEDNNNTSHPIENILIGLGIIIFIIQLFLYFYGGSMLGGHEVGTGLSAKTGIYKEELNIGYTCMWLHFLCTAANYVIIGIGSKFRNGVASGKWILIYITTGLCTFGSLLFAFSGCTWAMA